MSIVIAGSTSILLHRAEIDEWTKIGISIFIGILGGLIDLCKDRDSFLFNLALNTAMFGGIVNLALLLVAPGVSDFRKFAISLVVGAISTIGIYCADTLLPKPSLDRQSLDKPSLDNSTIEKHGDIQKEKE